MLSTTTPKNENKFHFIAAAFILLFGAFVLLVADTTPVFAKESHIDILQDDDPPPGDPPPVEPGDDAGSDSPSLGESIIQSITKIFNIVRLDRTSLIDAYDGVLENTAKKAMDRLMPDLEESVEGSLMLVFQYNSDGIDGIKDGAFSDEVKTMWGWSLSLAALFFPLLIVANIAEVYVSGVSAPVARAEMLQSVLFSMGRMALAGGSYWIVDQGLRIGWSLTGILMNQSTGVSISSGPTVVAFIASFIIGAIAMVFVPPLGLMIFYIGLFGMFLLLLLVSALLLSHYAFITIVIMMVVISPVIFVVGGLPFFRWLFGMWLKVATGVIFLPVANAILYKMAELMLGQWENASIIKVFIGLGFLGLLITINGAIGKFVFAPIIEAGRKAKDATVGLGKVLASVAASSATGGVSLAALKSAGSDFAKTLSTGQSTLGSLGGNGAAPQTPGGDGSDGPTRPGGGSGGNSGGSSGRSPSPAQRAFQSARADVLDGKVSPQEMARARSQTRTATSALSALAARDPIAGAAVRSTMGQLTTQLDELNAMMPQQEQSGPGGGSQRHSGLQLRSNDVLGHFAHNTNICISTNQDTEVPIEPGNLANSLRFIPVEIIFCSIKRNIRNRKKRN